MTHKVDLEQQEDFHFAIRFGDAIPLLRAGAGPTPKACGRQFPSTSRSMTPKERG